MRMTMDDIIKKGDYLSASFNPEKLTIAHLVGILQRYEIQVPGIHTKADLINLFNREVRGAALQPEQLNNSEAAGASSRQVPQNGGISVEGTRSGWVYNNVFQSGVKLNAESSAKQVYQKSRAVYPSPIRHSAPPAVIQPPAVPRDDNQRPTRLPSIYRPEHNNTLGGSSSEDEYDEIPRSIFSAATPFTRSHRNGILRKWRRVSVFKRILLVGFVLVLLSLVFLYKLESSPIGYCDSGSRDNANLDELRKKRLEQDICLEKQLEHEEMICPLSFSFFRPEACTPCPAHASCHLDDVVCDDGYLLIRHPLSLVPTLSRMCDGLPGLGPVAFPPRCNEDPTRKRSIDELVKGIKTHLAIERGRRICANEIPEMPFEGEEAQRWGFEIVRLKDDMKRMATPQIARNFDFLFGEAVQQLLEYGLVIKSGDDGGEIFLATEHVIMSWRCLITTFICHTWKEWRNSILGLLALSFSAIYGRYQIIAKRYEYKRVSELVFLVLDTLRNQEMSHHTDPITTPIPYLSSLQLRDSMLEDEHSIAVRARLWARVEKIVEGNANVRANMDDLPGGDELRVWRWVGAAGRPRQISPKDADSINIK